MVEGLVLVFDRQSTSAANVYSGSNIFRILVRLGVGALNYTDWECMFLVVFLVNKIIQCLH